MLQEQETRMFSKHEKLVLDLILGRQALLRQRLTNYETDLFQWKQSLKNLKKANNKTKQQTTEPTRALAIRRKLMHLRDRSRRKNFRKLDIKEGPRESWQECENKIYDLLEEKLEMDTGNVSIERAQCVGKKSNDKKRVIVVQFSFYLGKTVFLKTVRSSRELKFPYLKIFPMRQCKFAKKNVRRY